MMVFLLIFKNINNSFEFFIPQNHCVSLSCLQQFQTHTMFKRHGLEQWQNACFENIFCPYFETITRKPGGGCVVCEFINHNWKFIRFSTFSSISYLGRHLKNTIKVCFFIICCPWEYLNAWVLDISVCVYELHCPTTEGRRT